MLKEEHKLPVDVRGSKTSVLKLSNSGFEARTATGSEHEKISLPVAVLVSKTRVRLL